MKTILVVDDEFKIVKIARDYLEHAGFAVLTANEGKTALFIARSAKPDPRPGSAGNGRPGRGPRPAPRFAGADYHADRTR